jgi:hypothetical protein
MNTLKLSKKIQGSLMGFGSCNYSGHTSHWLDHLKLAHLQMFYCYRCLEIQKAHRMLPLCHCARTIKTSSSPMVQYMPTKALQIPFDLKGMQAWFSLCFKTVLPSWRMDLLYFAITPTDSFYNVTSTRAKKVNSSAMKSKCGWLFYYWSVKRD